MNVILEHQQENIKLKEIGTYILKELVDCVVRGSLTENVSLVDKHNLIGHA